MTKHKLTEDTLELLSKAKHLANMVQVEIFNITEYHKEVDFLQNVPACKTLENLSLELAKVCSKLRNRPRHSSSDHKHSWYE